MGAILANVVTTELVILLVCFFFLLIVGATYESVLVFLFVMALVFPSRFLSPQLESCGWGLTSSLSRCPNIMAKPSKKHNQCTSPKASVLFMHFWVILPISSPARFFRHLGPSKTKGSARER